MKGFCVGLCKNSNFFLYISDCYASNWKFCTGHFNNSFCLMMNIKVQIVNGATL